MMKWLMKWPKNLNFLRFKILEDNFHSFWKELSNFSTVLNFPLIHYTQLGQNYVGFCFYSEAWSILRNGCFHDSAQKRLVFFSSRKGKILGRTVQLLTDVPPMLGLHLKSAISPCYVSLIYTICLHYLLHKCKCQLYKTYL